LINFNDTTTKVLVLGDSFTFGWLLKNEDTYINLLAKANNHMVFHNAAAGGWGASDYTAYMETYCSKINPDIVLIIMNSDDVGRMLRSSLYSYNPTLNLVFRSKYEVTLRDKLKVLLNAFPLYNFLLENSHLIQLTRSTYLGTNVSKFKKIEKYNSKVFRFGLRNIKSIDYSNKFSAALFKHLKKISTNCESELRIIYSGVQKKRNLGIYPTLEFIEYAKGIDFFQNVGIRFIDLTNNPYLIEYQDNSSKYVIKNDAHPNEAGAKLLFKAINESGILSNNR